MIRKKKILEYYQPVHWIISIIKSWKIISVKVEKILKGSLDSIPSPSPSMKISNYGHERLFEV